MSSTPPGPNNSWQPKSRDYNSAPTYGQQPRKSRAGLIIALILVLAVVALGAIAIVAYRLLTSS